MNTVLLVSANQRRFPYIYIYIRYSQIPGPKHPATKNKPRWTQSAHRWIRLAVEASKRPHPGEKRQGRHQTTKLSDKGERLFLLRTSSFDRCTETKPPRSGASAINLPTDNKRAHGLFKGESRTGGHGLTPHHETRLVACCVYPQVT